MRKLICYVSDFKKDSLLGCQTQEKILPSLLKIFLMFIFKELILSSEEKITFKLHLTYSVIEGIILGVLALNEFVFVKSLKGSDFQLSILIQISAVVLVFTIFFNEYLKKVRNKKKLLQIVAIITRLPLILLIFFPHTEAETIANSYYHWAFLVIFLIYFFAQPIIYPTINLFLKNIFSQDNFGKLYSISTSINKIVMMVVTFLYGLLLDYDHYSFIYVFPIIGVLGIVSVYLLSLIKYEDTEYLEVHLNIFESIKKSFKDMRNIIRNNVPYKHFEWAFMYYGFAFLGTVSIITIFYESELHLNYSSVAFYRNSYNIIAILTLPFFGRLLGKIDPRRFGVITFCSILLYLLCLLLTYYFPVHFELLGLKLYLFMLLFVIFHGIFAATMSLLWNIGSSYFCKNEEAANYHAIHLTLTGYRSLLAPFLGIVFYHWLGYVGAFLIGIGLVAVAISIMIWSEKKYKV